MLTSILLYLALMPVDRAPESCLLESPPEPAALSPAPAGGQDPSCLIHAEAVDEENEEEEFHGPQSAVDSPFDGKDVDLFISLRSLIGSPHLRSAQDRLRFSRSPPEDSPLPADHCVRAAIG
jgi:hypothetical protein